MSYILNQFNQPKVAASDVSSADNQVYMTPLSNGTPKRRKNASDSGVSGTILDPFFDECLQFDSSLEVGVNYYFHAKIKRMKSDQLFYVSLVNFTDSGKSQYLKTITVQAGLDNEWVDFEIIFSPLITFDCILFQLQRTVEDYREETRYPVIVYEELSRINNVISSKIQTGAELLKIGVQSHPGLMMCINGEEIHIGRTGIYEIRNGVVLVNFFSVLFAAVEDEEGQNPLIDPRTGSRCSLEEYLDYVASLPIVTEEDNTNSQCIFKNSKLRAIDAYTLDYMYEEG